MISTNTLPLKKRLLLGVIGGFLGALNPALLLLKPDHIANIQNHFSFGFGDYWLTSATFFIVLLFIPATLSTLLVLPWLLKQIQGQSPVNMVKSIWLGIKFGCLACVPTAFFFMCEMTLFSQFQKQSMPLSELALHIAGGTGLLAFLGFFMIPAMAITGPVFVQISSKIAKN